MVHVMIAWKGTKPTAFRLADRFPQRITDQQAKELEEATTVNNFLSILDARLKFPIAYFWQSISYAFVFR
jgi:hypothetical protein